MAAYLICYGCCCCWIVISAAEHLSQSEVLYDNRAFVEILVCFQAFKPHVAHFELRYLVEKKLLYLTQPD